MARLTPAFRPFAARARRTIVAIVVTFAVISAASAAISIWTTAHSRNRAAVVEVAARQRTLADRYVQQLVIVRDGGQADPAHTAELLAQSAQVLLDGGTAPSVNGDDDETALPATTDPEVRAQLEQEQRLVTDLTTAGKMLLAGRDVADAPLTAGERIGKVAPLQRVRILAALTSNVSLNSVRTVAANADHNINHLITLQVGLGIGGLVVSLLLAWGLVATTRRQTAHFRSLVTSSTDLVLVLGDAGCRYVSQSVAKTLGTAISELLGDGYLRAVHEDDREAVERARLEAQPERIVVRLRNAAGDWRHLDAHVTDLRSDRYVRGVVLNARDITDRVRLERELTLQAQRDNFGSQLVEALEMADEEDATFYVVERAMVEVEPEAPMELLLSDSSRAQLERAAASPVSGAPGCPVESPFSCVAVRRGNPVVFETSEALNACPKLRDRPGGACSAVCVPVTFMGRALGVLHATGPAGEPLRPEQVAQLTTLATQAGARIGTVRAFQRTQLQASTDSLTGLINRRTLESHVRDLIHGGGIFAFALADLDRFKNLNDTSGHEAGDRALRLFAQVVQGVLRGQDVVARYGGEEFAILLPGLDREQGVSVLERVRAALADAHGGDHPAFTASFGVTDSSQADGLERLIQVADQGLYVSKESGRDTITIGDPGAVPAERVLRDVAGSAIRHAGGRGPRPALHAAVDEYEPRPSGVEIR